MRIVNPTWKNPERIEYRMTRDINNLPRVQIDNSNGALTYIEFLLDTGAVGFLIRKDAVKKLGTKSINKMERVRYIGVANKPRISLGTVEKTLFIAERAFHVKFDVVEDLPVEGILGANFINQYVILINNQTGILTLQQEPIKFHDKFKLERRIGRFKLKRICIPAGKKISLTIFSSLPKQNERFNVLMEKEDDNNGRNEDYSDNHKIDLEQRNNFHFTENANFTTLHGRDRIIGLSNELNLSHLSDEKFQPIENLVEHFNDDFFLNGNELTHTDIAIHEIETSTNIPINKRQYRMPESTKARIDEENDEILKQGIIKPSTNPWNAPVLYVPKKPGADG